MVSIGVAPVEKRLCQCDEREGNGTGADWLRAHVVAVS